MINVFWWDLYKKKIGHHELNLEIENCLFALIPCTDQLDWLFRELSILQNTLFRFIIKG